MAKVERVTSHNEVSSGDLLVYSKVNGKEVTTRFLDCTEQIVLNALSQSVEESLRLGFNATFTFVRYESPIRQKLIREITIKNGNS